MTVQPEDIEPEAQRAATSDWRRDPNFNWPQRMPWSQHGPHFVRKWGRADPGNPQPEHLEIIGQTGSGKTYFLMTLLQEMYAVRKSAAVLICTKQHDDVFTQLGWPIIDRASQVNDNPNAIYWPRTSLTGTRKREYQERKIMDLLNTIWVRDSNRIVAFDEVGYIESLSGEMRVRVQEYWREGRSLGITVVGMKQRPQGALRDMHSETWWTVAFKPKDRSDAERWAELFGAKRDWLPVLDDLSRQRHEFVIFNPLYEDAWISWVDTELHPQKVERNAPWYLGGGRGARRA